MGLMLLMLGGAATDTVKLIPLLATPPTVTTTLPVVAPAGTATVMLVALQLVGVAAVPLNVTVLDPWVAPKFAPVIVTGVPTGPEVGLRLLMLGGAIPVPLSGIASGTIRHAAPQSIVTFCAGRDIFHASAGRGGRSDCTRSEVSKIAGVMVANAQP